MTRKSRNPQSAATVHEMDPQARAHYEGAKAAGTLGSGVVGWSRPHDPWAWSNATAADVWLGRDRSNAGIWPPDVEAT